MTLNDSYPFERLCPPVKVTGEEFEKFVLYKFKESYPSAEITHRENIIGTDGEYNIDIAIRFQELGVNFLVLVECKHHKSPIKRDYIQILRDRVESIGAQKGILVSSSSFQLGAINYAKTHNIALIRIINDEFRYEQRSKDGVNRRLIDIKLSGHLTMNWIESITENSLSSRVINSFEEIFSDS